MKKKTIAAVLVILIVLLIAALMLFRNKAKRDEELQQHAAAQNPASAAAEAAPTAEPVVLEEDQLTTNVSAEEAAKQMLPVIDSAVRVMYEKGAGFYDMESDSFVWDVLAMLCASNDISAQGIETKDGSVYVPADIMKKIAAACFASRSELPELPKEISNVKYDSETKVYAIEQSDAGDMSSEVMETIPLGDGGYSVKVALVNKSDAKMPLLSTYQFDILSYPEGTKPEAPIFPMSIFNGYDTCNVLAQIQAIEEKDGEIMLALHHVQLHWEADEEDSEVYVPLIVADTKSDETLKLFTKDAVDWNTIGVVITGEDQGFKSSDEAFEWFKEHYTEKVMEENMVYQMRVYDGVIYSVAPLYAFYFQG